MRPRPSSISDPALHGSDALGTAKVLAAAIKRVEGADLVLTATESSDGYTGTVPEQIAGLLDLPSVTFAKSIAVDGSTVKVERQTEAGYDDVECPLPAVVSVTAGVVEPRYPSFKGIMAAKSKPVDEVTVADLGLDASQGRLGRRPPGDHQHRGRRRRVRPARSSRTTAPASRRSSPISTTSRSSRRPLIMTLAKIWVFAEATDGKVSSTTLEILTKARELAGTVEAIYAGGDADAIAGVLGAHGATTVHTTGDLG